MKHRWFSGKISRCHLFQINSASPGFDSRPMQRSSFCHDIDILQWWVKLVSEWTGSGFLHAPLMPKQVVILQKIAS
jgi:hypothetical protein